MLSVKNLHYHIGSKSIIDNITIDFRPGTLYVIVGPNGSGKSTFLKIFSGEIKPQRGEVLYDTIDIFHIQKKEIARRRAVMSQQPELHFPLTVSEVVMMGRYPHFNYKPSRQDENICDEMISLMGIRGFEERDYLTLSGGEKQRVQFARVLAQIYEAPAVGNRYLFLDEPIASLDIHYQHEFLKIVQTFKKVNTIIVAVLHDLNLSVQYADEMIFMKAGRIVKHGITSQVLSKELVQDVFDIPVNIIDNPVYNRPLLVF